MKGGWQTRTLGDVCEKITQGPNPKYDTREQEEYRVIKTKDLYDDVIHYDSTDRISKELFSLHSRSALRFGDILLAIVGQGSINKCNVFERIAGKHFIFTRAYGLLRPNRLLVNPYFVKHFLQSSDGKGMVDSGIAGTSGQQVVTTTHLKGLQIPVPPLPEQQRIVALLDEAFADPATAKVSAEQNLQNAREFSQSQLQSVFSQRGKGWVEHALGDLIDIQNAHAFKSAEYAEAGYFVIRIGNVQDGEITLANPKFIKLADKKLERFILNEGDILISLTGNIGRVDIIQENQLPAVLNQRVARIAVKGQSPDWDFLFRFLLSGTFRESLQEAGHGAAQQNVSTKEIESVQISLPDMKEQRRIVEEFDSFAIETQRLTRIYERKVAALEELKKSLLRQAFNGEL
jgi:type I restriction enzyme S subunit